MRNPSLLATPEALNQSWSVDFMHDALVCGRRFRTFNIVDNFNCEALSIEIDLNLPALRVVRVLDRIAANRGESMKKRGAVVIYAAIADTYPPLCSPIENPGYQQANLSCSSLFRTAVRVCNK